MITPTEFPAQEAQAFRLTAAHAAKIASLFPALRTIALQDAYNTHLTGTLMLFAR